MAPDISSGQQLGQWSKVTRMNVELFWNYVSRKTPHKYGKPNFDMLCSLILRRAKRVSGSSWSSSGETAGGLQSAASYRPSGVFFSTNVSAITNASLIIVIYDGELPVTIKPKLKINQLSARRSINQRQNWWRSPSCAIYISKEPSPFWFYPAIDLHLTGRTDAVKQLKYGIAGGNRRQ